MSGIDRDTPLGTVVTRVPDAAQVFDAYRIDFCCGGQQTLGAAAVELGIDPDVVLEAIGALEVPDGPDRVPTDIGELVDHIETTHHAYLHAELGYLDGLAEKVAEVHGERHPELWSVRSDVRALVDDLEPHLMKEERILFPMIRRLAAGEPLDASGPPSVAAPIGVMMRDHDAAGDLLARLRDDARDFLLPEDGCASYRLLYERLERLEADTHLHVHKENNVLFPAVMELAP